MKIWISRNVMEGKKESWLIVEASSAEGAALETAKWRKEQGLKLTSRYEVAPRKAEASTVLGSLTSDGLACPGRTIRDFDLDKKVEISL